MATVEQRAAEVIDRHAIGAYNGMQTACSGCHLWMTDAEYRRHLVALLTNAGLLARDLPTRDEIAEAFWTATPMGRVFVWAKMPEGDREVWLNAADAVLSCVRPLASRPTTPAHWKRQPTPSTAWAARWSRSPAARTLCSSFVPVPPGSGQVTPMDAERIAELRAQAEAWPYAEPFTGPEVTELLAEVEFARKACDGYRIERDEAEDARDEARAALDRVRKLADGLGHGAITHAAMADEIRRAIEGGEPT